MSGRRWRESYEYDAKRKAEDSAAQPVSHMSGAPVGQSFMGAVFALNALNAPAVGPATTDLLVECRDAFRRIREQDHGTIDAAKFDVEIDSILTRLDVCLRVRGRT